MFDLIRRMIADTMRSTAGLSTWFTHDRGGWPSRGKLTVLQNYASRVSASSGCIADSIACGCSG